MARSTLIVILGLAFGAVVGLAYVGGFALLGTFDRPEPPTCEIIEVDVLLHSVDLIEIPGGGDPIPMTGALHNYTRLDCNGVEFLLRSDVR